MLLTRLTVGVDLGIARSQYCILALPGETPAEGQLRTTQEDVGEFIQVLTATRASLDRRARQQCCAFAQHPMNSVSSASKA